MASGCDQCMCPVGVVAGKGGALNDDQWSGLLT